MTRFANNGGDNVIDRRDDVPCNCLSEDDVTKRDSNDDDDDREKPAGALRSDSLWCSHLLHCDRNILTLMMLLNKICRWS